MQPIRSLGSADVWNLTMSTATSAAPGLDFEGPILELETQKRSLEQLTERTVEQEEQLRQLRRQVAEVTQQVYAGLTPWQVVQIARHRDRPYTSDYLSLVFEDFVELHGDRRYGDDRAILTGFAKLDQQKVMVIGHQKGRTYKERSLCYFGCAHPEGYRKAILKMKMAEKYGLPVICLIDTPGAYPGIGAEERGQSQAIAENMYEMSRLKTPVICIVIGEGGSGGALGIGVGDRVAMLQYSYYSVISPEGCAGILWKSHQHAEKAANALKFTSKDLLRLGVVDCVIDEPLGGAHRDPHQMAFRVKQFLSRTLRDLLAQPVDQLVDTRYEKFRRMGVFLEDPVGTAGEADVQGLHQSNGQEC
jgi:acetyl-CoA carboxylase carboxyl transferase subunit alpha